MAIEIRELVIKASVQKQIGKVDEYEYVTKADLAKFQDKLTAQLVRKMRDLIVESRSSR